MKTLLLFLLLIPGAAKAAWQGRTDFSPAVSPLWLRELNDGQHLFGITKENLFHLDQDGIQRAHVGLFQAWNSEHGNASFGPLVGIDIPLHTALLIGAVGDALELPSLFKPAQYFGSALSLDAFGGYRPIHSADVNGNFVYGFAVRLNVAFGIRELKQGL